MISKKTRRASAPTEPLKQFQIGVGKGVDTTRNADDLNTVSAMTNLDLTPSGDAELRKPAVRLNSFSCAGGEILNVIPLYRDGYFLKITKVDGATRAEIVNVDDVPQEYILRWADYTRETEHSLNCTAAEPMVFAVWDDVKAVDTSTTTLILNAKVNLEYERTTTDGTTTTTARPFTDTLYSPELYSGYDVKKFPRTLQVYWTDTEHWIVKIVNPIPNSLNSAEGELGLDANLALDNPYAIRDEYSSSAPTIKNILVYGGMHKDPYSGSLTNTTNIVKTTLSPEPKTISVTSAQAPTELERPSAWSVSVDTTRSPSITESSQSAYVTIKINMPIPSTTPISRRSIRAVSQGASTLIGYFPIYAVRRGINSVDFVVTLYYCSISNLEVFSLEGGFGDLNAINLRGFLFITSAQKSYSVQTSANVWDTLDYATGATRIVTTTGHAKAPTVHMALYFIRSILNSVAVNSENHYWTLNKYLGPQTTMRTLAARLYRGLPGSFSDPTLPNHIPGNNLIIAGSPSTINLYRRDDTKEVYFCGFPCTHAAEKTHVYGGYYGSSAANETVRFELNTSPISFVNMLPADISNTASVTYAPGISTDTTRAFQDCF